jgi:hypothetical protein
MTKDQIIQAITGRLTESNKKLAWHLEVHNAIARVIAAKWEGKKINKRFIAQLRAELGIPEVEEPGKSTMLYLRIEYGQCNITVWGSRYDCTHDNREDFFLGYQKEHDGRCCYERLTAAGFEQSDLRNGANTAKAIKENNLLRANERRLGYLADAVLAVQSANLNLSNWKENIRETSAEYLLEELAKKD